MQHLIIDKRAAVEFFLFIKPIKQHKNSHKTFVINYNEESICNIRCSEGFSVLRRKMRKEESKEKKNVQERTNGFKPSPLSGLQSLDF